MSEYLSEHLLQKSATAVLTDERRDVGHEPGSSVVSAPVATTSLVVWTPRFIVFFALLFVIGLILASLLTQLWLNGLINAVTIIEEYCALVCASSLVLVWKMRDIWMRLGGGCICLWSVFFSLHFLIPIVSGLDPQTTLVAHLNIVTQSAFLGAAVCFACARPFRRWDSWFFALLPLVGIIKVALSLFLHPSDLPGSNFNETMIVGAFLWLGVLIWWLRPTNWLQQPGVTLLFGTIPLLQICFTSRGYYQNDTSFFFTLVFLSAFILLNIRLLQSEEHLFKR